MVFFLFAPGAKVSLCTMMADECIIFYAVVPIHSYPNAEIFLVGQPYIALSRSKIQF